MFFALALHTEIHYISPPGVSSATTGVTNVTDKPNPNESAAEASAAHKDVEQKLSPDDAQAVIQAINEVERTEAERLNER